MLQNYIVRFVKMKYYFRKKMKQYSPLFVLGNDADVCHNLCVCLENQNSNLNSVGDFKEKKNWLGVPN
jgi:hypothetical protein